MTKRKEPAAEPADDVGLEHQAPDGVDAAAVAAEWAKQYPKGVELFCGTFDANDFDTEYGDTAYPDGTTVAVRRGLRYPTPGWLRRHAHLRGREITFALLETHASDEALKVLDNLKTEAWESFIEAWGNDGEILPKSSRSARRSGTSNPPSGKTS